VLRVLAEAGRPLQVGDIYSAVEKTTLTDLRVLADDDVIMLREREILRDPLEGRSFVPEQPPHLTADQARAWERIAAIMDASDKLPVLLHGVTGSGKTELYLRAVEKALARGQTAIVMVPEIALTPQTVRRFGRRFPGKLGLVHSRLSQGERYDTWRRAREGQFSVVIGPRSALFTPLPELGLIVLDECHDDSYKQTPPIRPPYYHTLDAASTLAQLTDATLIMGTATPNVTRYKWAQEGRYELVTLPARIMGHRRVIKEQAARYNIAETRYAPQADAPEEAVMIDLPPVEVIDMRQELRVGNTSMFSRTLQTALEETLERDEQAILFLNRRGSSTHVFCRDCGHVMKSPRSDIPMTYHTYGPHEGKLVDHLTGYSEPHPETCPACGSARIKFFGGGTQRLEDEVTRRFPQARITRWDADTTSSKGSHEDLLDQFVKGEANVLVGTQMVAKGLDLPLVTLVGVISADTALYLPDYRAGERTFQLLTQVAGRAGRGILGGQVLLQTYAPQHYAVRAAAGHDFAAFYAEELEKRAELGYPPYNRLVKLVVRGYDLDRVEQEAAKLHKQLSRAIAQKGLSQTSLIGPAPCFYARIDNVNRWQVIVRGPAPAALVAEVVEPARYLQIDVDPVSLL
jgi:primosomal protein N' (replication factor Y)